MDDSDGSDSGAQSQTVPMFSCHSSPSSQSQLHTYLLASKLLYNLGMSALNWETALSNWVLTPVAANRGKMARKPP
ncbi:hypothetical protein BDZ94DRAFT_1311325 [Collybia nuda]|uniref:Uncharacterized protein n=1 Tax=Collybia nuda TaxID=64659 RepID=A0A9P6CH95_9AGAR|nr:hypothetical protein BDZ94DRAFT_1311325 [Collybia nuda]